MIATSSGSIASAIKMIYNSINFGCLVMIV